MALIWEPALYQFRASQTKPLSPQNQSILRDKPSHRLEILPLKHKSRINILLFKIRLLIIKQVSLTEED